MDGLLRGVLGILLGAWLYAEAYPLLRGNLLAVGQYGKLTLPGILGVNHWLVIVPLAALGVAALLWLDRRQT
jgi:xanthosine utilization system XapX-like protein